MSEIRLVTFTPSDPFFFGGNQTFGDSVNYFAESRKFPQQTTLVGVIRHALFEAGQQANMGQSFRVNLSIPSNTTSDFGWLKSLSPVFIKGENHYYLPVRVPISEDSTGAFGATDKINFQPKGEIQINYGGDWESVSLATTYKEKEGFEYMLAPSSGKPISYSEVFNEFPKIGLGRDRVLHTALQGRFYQQNLFKMKSGYAFACFVEGTTELFDILKRRNMPIGGEKVNFVVGVEEPTTQTFESQFNTALIENYISSNANWIFLSSDALVDSNVFDDCQFQLPETISFRNIVTPGNYTPQLSKSKNGTERYKSQQFILLRRGTVLFPKDLKKVLNSLNNPDFKKIGYNYFITNNQTAI